MVCHFDVQPTSLFVSEEAVNAFLSTLPLPRRERIEKTANKELRRLRLAQEKALILALATLGEDYASLSIAYTDLGKPYVEDRPDLAISLSHRGIFGCALCVKSLDGIPVACGVDIERVTPLDEKHQRLKNRFLPQDTPMTPHDFFLAWTKTEAFVKLTGAGMGGTKDLSQGDHIHFSHSFLEDEQGNAYILCLAHKKDV